MIIENFLESESVDADFRPTPITPGLQFFEGVETTGMAMRAGLRPGDFLLEINGIDVRCARFVLLFLVEHLTQRYTFCILYTTVFGKSLKLYKAGIS